MPTVLLDHPWSIVDAMTPTSDAFEVLERFDVFRKSRRGFTALPFVALADYLRLCNVINNDVERRATATYFKLLVEPYVRWIEAQPQRSASPDPEPRGAR